MIEHLDKAGIELIGTRTAAEIAQRLLAEAADRRARPLPADDGRADRELRGREGAGARRRRPAWPSWRAATASISPPGSTRSRGASTSSSRRA